MLLYAIDRRTTDLDWRSDRALAAITVVTTLLALNLHATNSAICGVTVGVVALEQVRRRRLRWAALLLGGAIVATSLLGAALLAERSYIAVIAPMNFVHTGFVKCIQILWSAVTGALARNIVVIACLGVTAFTLLRRAPVRPAEPDTPAWRFAVLLLLSLLLSGAALTAVNGYQPTVIERYVIAFGILSAALFAILTAHRIVSRTWILALFLLNAALVPIPRTILGDYFSKNWDEGGALAAREVGACPGTIVYGVDRYAMITGPESPDGLEIKEFGLREDAKRFGFAVQPIRYRVGITHVASPGACPTVLWSEHSYGDYSLARLVLSVGLPIAPGRNGLIQELRTHTGVVIIIPHAAMLRADGEAK